MHRAPGIHRPHRVAVPNPRSARYLSTHRSRIAAAGFTLVEVVVTLAIATLVMAGLVGVLDTAFKAEAAARERNALARDARFAMRRMVRAVSRTQRLMLPLAENPGTAWLESIREPGVLAVALDPSLDRDGDGFADADNDKDGLIDEDVGFDIHNDFASGLSGIDDDNDGEVDESNVEDDDEDEDDGGAKDEEISNGVDDDGDGTVDEDLDADMNQDNQPGIAGVDTTTTTP